MTTETDKFDRCILYEIGKASILPGWLTLLRSERIMITFCYDGIYSQIWSVGRVVSAHGNNNAEVDSIYRIRMLGQMLPAHDDNSRNMQSGLPTISALISQISSWRPSDLTRIGLKSSHTPWCITGVPSVQSLGDRNWHVRWKFRAQAMARLSRFYRHIMELLGKSRTLQRDGVTSISVDPSFFDSVGDQQAKYYSRRYWTKGQVGLISLWTLQKNGIIQFMTF